MKASILSAGPTLIPKNYYKAQQLPDFETTWKLAFDKQI